MLFQSDDVVSVFSERAANMSLSYGNCGDSLLNRKKFLDKFGVDYKDLVCARQVHGRGVYRVRRQDRGRGALCPSQAIDETDGLVSAERELPLAIFTADCLPIFLYDPSAKCIGLLHAGWRSTQARIVTNAINLMRGLFGIDPGNLNVGFGPCLRRCCYEVGHEFESYFPQELIEIDGRHYFDLAKANRGELLGNGVKDKNIFDTGICTSCQNRRYFSYRKEGDSCGRMMSVIMLR